MTNKLAWLRASGWKGEATDAAAACGLPARQTNLKIVWQNYALMSARSAPFHLGVVRRGRFYVQIMQVNLLPRPSPVQSKSQSQSTKCRIPCFETDPGHWLISQRATKLCKIFDKPGWCRQVPKGIHLCAVLTVRLSLELFVHDNLRPRQWRSLN